MTTDAEIQELLAELAAFRKRDNVIHPKVEPAYYVGQWVFGPDGNKVRVMGRAIDWDKNVTYTFGLPDEKENWTPLHFEVSENSTRAVLHKFEIGDPVRHDNTSYQIGAKHFDANGNPFYELRDPEANGGRFAKHATEAEITGVEPEVSPTV